MTVFPEGLGDLANKSFEEVFRTMPKWVEFVYETWTDNCTGIFLEFQKFVADKLDNEIEKNEHRQRCLEYVKTKELGDLPRYLLKYKK